MMPATDNPSATRTSNCPKHAIHLSIYDLLPTPSPLSTFLWSLGSSLLHTGVHIPHLNLEYAYGGHSIPKRSGVYHTSPHDPPPGGHFRDSIFIGWARMSKEDMETVVRGVSEEFLGGEYRLLERNCNHFSEELCRRLTGQGVPAWVNRASRVGGWAPCVVPREWIEVPECEDGERADAGDEEPEVRGSEDEGRRMLSRRRSWGGGLEGEVGRGDGGAAGSSVMVRDAEGRKMPISEVAPAARKSP